MNHAVVAESLVGALEVGLAEVDGTTCGALEGGKVGVAVGSGEQNGSHEMLRRRRFPQSGTHSSPTSWVPLPHESDSDCVRELMMPLSRAISSSAVSQLGAAVGGGGAGVGCTGTMAPVQFPSLATALQHEYNPSS